MRVAETTATERAIAGALESGDRVGRRLAESFLVKVNEQEAKTVLADAIAKMEA